MVVEFQAYRDKPFVPNVMLRCELYRLQHPARSMRCHVIYLDREFESVPLDDGGLFQPTVHYLPELLRQLTIQYHELFRNGVLPEAAFRDLTARTEQELQQYRMALEDLEHQSA